MDPLRAIGEICRERGVWLHVDAAMAGTAALCPELRRIHDGVELADSYCFNPHKWMFTNFDCTCFWVADRRALIDALSIMPDYLRNRASDSGEVIDYRDWHVPLGRRFRALKLWFVIRHYGVEGLRRHVRAHVALGAGVAVVDRAGPAVRARRAHAAQPGLLPPPRRRRRQPVAARAAQRERQALPDLDAARRQAHAAHVDRPDLDRAPPRRGGVDAYPATADELATAS